MQDADSQRSLSQHLKLIFLALSPKSKGSDNHQKPSTKKSGHCTGRERHAHTHGQKRPAKAHRRKADTTNVGVSETRGTLFWGPYNEDPTI